MVVGSGPNGLAAAAHLLGAGASVLVIEGSDRIGGGARTEELTLPGLCHDVCSAVHPLAATSPAFAALSLADHGLRWCHPEVDVAHPLDRGRAGVLVRSLDDTVAGLGPDGGRWRRTFGPLADRFDDLLDDVLGPVVHIPRHPLGLARFGVPALAPANAVGRRFRTDEGRALFAGLAAHSFQPLGRPATAAFGLLLGASAHAVGWPVAAGGSQAITDALAACVQAGGGRIETGRWVRDLGDLPDHRVALFDVAPGAFARIAGDRLPARVARAYRRYRHGPAAFKVDLAVAEGIPWAEPAARRAGTVHVGGTAAEVTAAEADVAQGRMPDRPFVLVAQQHLADPTRSAGDVHPIWAYAHVPHGWAGDATEAVLGQIERFAPGVRDRILATAVRGPDDLAAHNPNFVGGDISTGANDAWQTVFRPRPALDPYATGIAGTFLCSAATPPGGGVHGMCGLQAARRALAALDRGSR